MQQPFIPSWKWHVKTLAVLLLLCTVAFFVISYARQYLPFSYQRRIPPQEVTPWLK